MEIILPLFIGVSVVVVYAGRVGKDVEHDVEHDIEEHEHRNVESKYTAHRKGRMVLK